MKSPLFATVVVVTMATTSCVTEPNFNGAHPSGESPGPFLSRDHYPERLGAILHDVLAGHGFTRPWISARGENSSVWFVAERWESESRFDRLFVCVSSERLASASITSYTRGPTDWAILGHRFADPQSEANAISAAVTQKWAAEVNR